MGLESWLCHWLAYVTMDNLFQLRLNSLQSWKTVMSIKLLY